MEDSLRSSQQKLCQLNCTGLAADRIYQKPPCHFSLHAPETPHCYLTGKLLLLVVAWLMQRSNAHQPWSLCQWFPSLSLMAHLQHLFPQAVCGKPALTCDWIGQLVISKVHLQWLCFQHISPNKIQIDIFFCRSHCILLIQRSTFVQNTFGCI